MTFEVPDRSLKESYLYMQTYTSQEECRYNYEEEGSNLEIGLNPILVHVA
jgi:hypothetical protein